MTQLTQTSSSERTLKEKLEISDLKTELAWLEDAVERKKQQAIRLRASSNLGKRFQTRTFENYEGDDRAYQIAHDYAVNFDTIKDADKNSILFWGEYGVGKTHLAAAITNYVIDKGVPALFNTWSSHLGSIKQDFNNGYKNSMSNIPLLVIDDFGKEKQTDWSREVLFDVINARYERMLPTIITTNLDSKGLNEHMDRAIQSRLIEMCRFVKMEGKDRRNK